MRPHALTDGSHDASPGRWAGSAVPGEVGCVAVLAAVVHRLLTIADAVVVAASVFLSLALLLLSPALVALDEARRRGRRPRGHRRRAG